MREIQHNMKHNNIHIIGIPAREKEQGRGILFEKVMMENFFNLMRGKSHTNPGSSEGPNQEELKETQYRNIIFKMAKLKENLKGSKKNREVTCKGSPIRLTADISIETLQARREWQEIFQVMKSKDLQPRLFYPEQGSQLKWRAN